MRKGGKDMQSVVYHTKSCSGLEGKHFSVFFPALTHLTQLIG